MAVGQQHPHRARLHPRAGGTLGQPDGQRLLARAELGIGHPADGGPGGVQLEVAVERRCRPPGSPAARRGRRPARWPASGRCHEIASLRIWSSNSTFTRLTVAAGATAVVTGAMVIGVMVMGDIGVVAVVADIIMGATGGAATPADGCVWRSCAGRIRRGGGRGRDDDAWLARGGVAGRAAGGDRDHRTDKHDTAPGAALGAFMRGQRYGGKCGATIARRASVWVPTVVVGCPGKTRNDAELGQRSASFP